MTGLTTGADIFDHAIRHSSAYDQAIYKKLKEGKLGEALFFELALEDLRHAADLLRPIYDQTNGVDGWVSLEVSPLVLHNPARTIAAAKDLLAGARRPNFLVMIPGTQEGLFAVEEAIFAGVPVNVTLLFSQEQYQSAAEAYLRGIERRIAAGLPPNIGSVAAVSVNSWDAAVIDEAPGELHNQLGIAIARRIYKTCRELLSSSRWGRAFNAGARPQRILWTGTAGLGTEADHVGYISSLAAPLTVSSVSEPSLRAFADYAGPLASMPTDGGDCEAVIARFVQAGVDVGALADSLQKEGCEAMVKSWFELMTAIAQKSAALTTNHAALANG